MSLSGCEKNQITQSKGNNMQPAIKARTKVNGVNVDELFGTIDAVKKTPVIAKFKFHAKNEWKGGSD